MSYTLFLGSSLFSNHFFVLYSVNILKKINLHDVVETVGGATWKWAALHGSGRRYMEF